MPLAISKITTPKPRKSEIIEAAARLEFDKEKAAYEAQKIKMENEVSILKGRIQRYVQDHLAECLTAGLISIGNGCGSNYDHATSKRTPYRTISGTDVRSADLSGRIPASLQKAILNHLNKWERGVLPDGTAFKVISYPDFHQTKFKVKCLFDNVTPAATTKDGRVAAILNDPKATKAIEAMMKQLRQPATPALANAEEPALTA